jgi:hypothetical protein
MIESRGKKQNLIVALNIGKEVLSDFKVNDILVKVLIELVLGMVGKFDI